MKVVAWNWSLVIAVLLSLTLTEETSATIPGFVEDFSGTGPFSGFYIPGMRRGGNGYFEDGGYRMIEYGPGDHPLTNGNVIEHRVDGAGSFRSIIEFRHLELSVNLFNDFTNSGFVLSHFLNGNEGGGISTTLVNWDDNRTPDAWGISAPWSPINLHHVPAGKGTPVRIEMDFDYETRDFTFSYDWNAADDVAPIAFGPYQYEGDLTNLGMMLFSFNAGGPGTSADGLLDYLSRLPTDTAPGDFSGSGDLDVEDLAMLNRATGITRVDRLFDVNGDTSVTRSDIDFWVHELKKTYYGDVNLDGQFNSTDLVNAFGGGQYEDVIETNSSWSTGDWNGDADFTTADLVLAFQDGGYEKGPRAMVPESIGSAWLVVLAFGLRRRKKVRLHAISRNTNVVAST